MNKPLRNPDKVGALPPAEDRAGGLRPEPASQSQPKALIPSADEPCEWCDGYGQIFGHADDCHDDLCALNGDMNSCQGKVEPCGACADDANVVEHVWYECPQPCERQHCPYCDGGLAYCVVCQKGEAELEKSCPGAQARAETQSGSVQSAVPEGNAP